MAHTHRPLFFFCHASAAMLLLAMAPAAQAQAPKTLPPGPMLDGGTITLEGNALKLTLLKSSGTVAQLSPTAEPALDYTPGDILKQRSADTFYHLGDLDLRIRAEGATEWKDYSTAYRRQPVRVLLSDATHFSADLSPTFSADIPVAVTRTWAVEKGAITLRYAVTNRTSAKVHLGGLGIPMVFNNIMNGRTLEQAYKTCSFYDPYIGEDAGYVQVSRLTGQGPVLLAVPEGHTPFEAWKPILDKRSHADGTGLLLNDPTPRGVTFEGSFDWMVHSQGFAETEWKGVKEWNEPTEETLLPGQTVTYGVGLLVAPSLREIEPTLTANNRPVAVGIPGYILPKDTDGRLFLRYGEPVRSIVSEPAGAIYIHDDGPAQDKAYHAYTLRGVTWGASRLRIVYTDGTLQTIAYRTIKPETDAVADMGHFLFHQQWFDDANDPFHRAPSIISYDDSTGKQLVQESRVWIAGLSDEGGAGSWIAASMKEYLQPKPEEVAKLDSFVSQTIWGHLQESDGDHKFGVRKSLFFYQPDQMPANFYDPAINWKSWTSWNKKDAGDLGRSYNYPHVVAAYWSMYRIARNNPGMKTEHPWEWYLDHAQRTTLAIKTEAPYYLQFGQMEGTVFLRLLEDLKAEGWNPQAIEVEAMMRERAEAWNKEPYPFGSEMPWDSTGQEEVYAWTRYFDMHAKADETLNAVLAYTPVLPSWGYNGSARRYWDFLYGGKYPRIERQLHHYGSGLNAIPLLSEYRAHPADLYLLRAGYGGVMGPLTNIDEKGFASVAFHSFPDRMAYDPYTGDYGPNFLGHSLNTAVYVVNDRSLGWLAFGGNVEQKGNMVHVTVLDSSRARVYFAPLGLWLTLDAGQFESVDYDAKHGGVTLHLAAASATAQVARLHVDVVAPQKGRKVSTVGGGMKMERGAYVIPLSNEATSLKLTVH